MKNIPKYASAQFYVDNVLPRIKEKKIMSIKPFVDRLGEQYHTFLHVFGPFLVHMLISSVFGCRYDNVPPEINRLRCRVTITL